MLEPTDVVYFIRSAGLVKIGTCRASRMEMRLADLQTGNPEPLQLLARIDCVSGAALEARLHDMWRPLHVRGEWFRLTAELAAFIEREAACRHMNLAEVVAQYLETGAWDDCVGDPDALLDHWRRKEARRAALTGYFDPDEIGMTTSDPDGW